MKYFFNQAFHSFGAKTVNRTEIWRLTCADSHEWNLFTNGFGDLTGRVDFLRVGVDDNFRHRFGVVAVATAA
ncbi:hypothetical protein ABEV55_18325 [Aneurinibacillus thermoaerophilus]